ncbi:MAG TPA: pyruvoyl-dependent arginine decarboxylase, partial [Armatimonadetes bacterium]|nr:pyruvoyl-dependent arginine decarboxylase [Armatimonadota bacterium]
MVGEGIKRACLVVGAAEGGTELNAFDNALLAAGIGDVNLVKVSSIIPPGVELVDQLNPLPRGAFVPVVYASLVSREPGRRIAVAVGVGRAADGFGVVMEAEGEGREEVEGE